jgi:hypothetical protein
MAKHCIAAASKTGFARALIGATVVSSALGLPALAAHADTAAPVTRHTNTEPVAHKTGAQSEDKITVTAKQVLALAKSQIGTSENAAGGGTKYQKWYANSPRAAETIARDGGSRADYLNAAWCSMFVSWVGDHSGARPQVGWDAYTVEHAKWFMANHRWGSDPTPGAVVFFSWGGGKGLDDIQHVGFVEKDNHNGTITTIEGNTAGTVAERVRPKSRVVGYGYPAYADSDESAT